MKGQRGIMDVVMRRQHKCQQCLSDSDLNNKEKDKKHKTRKFRQKRFPENFDRVGCEGQEQNKSKYFSAPSLGQPSGPKRQNKTI